MRYDYLTFDCYGTLVDWRRGIVAAFREAAPAGSRLPPAGELLELHARHEAAVQAGPYRTYREVLTETAAGIAAELGLEKELAPFAFLADSLPGWPVFPDTRPALLALRRVGARLGILSNVDDDLLAATVRGLGVELDLRITAEQVRSYKPAAGHFELARQRIGDGRWLHVAQSLFHDVVPAQRLDLEAVWINRLGEPLPAGVEPRRTFPDLAGLAAWLAA